MTARKSKESRMTARLPATAIVGDIHCEDKGRQFRKIKWLGHLWQVCLEREACCATWQACSSEAAGA